MDLAPKRLASTCLSSQRPAIGVPILPRTLLAVHRGAFSGWPMNLVDYTHPGRVSPLYLPHDRRSAEYYLRLDELPPGHRYYSIHWALFRYPEWLEGGSAWVQARFIAEDLQRFAEQKGLDYQQLRPVVGSDDPAFDEGLAQALFTFDLRPLVAEVAPRHRSIQLQPQEA